MNAARWRKYGISYLFLVPSFAFVLTFLYYPMLLAFFHSFTKWNLVQSEWIGLDNYRSMFGSALFRKGMVNQLIYTLTDVAKSIVFPLAAAELIYLIGGSRLKYLFRTGFILPMLFPGIVTILLWQNMYDPTSGLINQTLQLIGLDAWSKPWLGDESTALWAIIAFGFPFISGLNFLIFYASIGNLSQEQIEAAKIDGASGWQVFASIHVPLLVPQIKLVTILTIIGSLQDFVKILVMTDGGPGDATINPAIIMYKAAFGSSQYGYGSAVGVALFLVILALTVFNLKVLKTDY